MHRPCPHGSRPSYPDDMTSHPKNLSGPSTSDHDDKVCYQLQARILSVFPESKIAACVRNPRGCYRPHLEDLSGGTCLHYAAQTKGLPPIFDEEPDSWDKLLEHFGGEVNARDKDGRTALSWAAEVGNNHAIRKLLGSSIRSERPNEEHPFYNDMDRAQKTPLFYLLRFRQNEAKKDGKCPTNDDFDRLLVGRLVWDLNFPNSEKFLLDLEERDYQEEPLDPFYLHLDVLNARIQGRTLLSHAVEHKDYNFVRVLLLVKGIDVTRVDVDEKTGVEGKSPFLHALDNDDETMVQLLNEYWWIDPIGDLQTLFKSFKVQSDLSPVKRLQRLLNMKLLDLEKALRCSVKLRELSMVQFLLENGASLRPIELKQEWFDLMDSTRHPEDKSSLAKFIELTELTEDMEDGKRTTHVLHAPKEKEDILSKANCRLIRFYRCANDCEEVPFAESEREHASHEVNFKHRHKNFELVCNIHLWFPNARDFFMKQGIPLTESEDTESKRLFIQWTTTSNGEVLYESSLSSGRFPDSSYAFISNLVSDVEVEWRQIFSTSEYRLSEYSTTLQGSALVRYLATERKFFATLRQALHQHLRSSFRLIDESHMKTQGLLKRGIKEVPSRRLELIDALQSSGSVLGESLDKQIQDIRDAIQVELAEISVGETIFMRRIGLVTFIYLPLMFAASLFGMNVNALQNNPDWRWYLLFCVGLLIFTFGLWVVSGPSFKLHSRWVSIAATLLSGRRPRKKLQHEA